jgi:hypothetical protein
VEYSAKPVPAATSTIEMTPAFDLMKLPDDGAVLPACREARGDAFAE